MTKHLHMTWPDEAYGELEAERIRTYAEHRLGMAAYIRAICRQYIALSRREEKVK